MNIYQEAIDVQNAVNLTAVASLLHRVGSQLSREGRGTDEIRRNPAVTLIVDKLLDLNGRPEGMEFNKAFDECEKLSKEVENVCDKTN